VFNVSNLPTDQAYTMTAGSQELGTTAAQILLSTFGSRVHEALVGSRANGGSVSPHLPKLVSLRGFIRQRQAQGKASSSNNATVQSGLRGYIERRAGSSAAERVASPASVKRYGDVRDKAIVILKAAIAHNPNNKDAQATLAMLRHAPGSSPFGVQFESHLCCGFLAAVSDQYPDTVIFSQEGLNWEHAPELLIHELQHVRGSGVNVHKQIMSDAGLQSFVNDLGASVQR